MDIANYILNLSAKDKVKEPVISSLKTTSNALKSDEVRLKENDINNIQLPEIKNKPKKEDYKKLREYFKKKIEAINNNWDDL